MDELKKTNQRAYDCLKENNLTHWSSSHFSIRSHFDMLVNNLSESFNKMILEVRGKSIMTMMERVRTKIMLLIVKKKEEVKKWKGMLCPNIKKKLDVNIKDLLKKVTLFNLSDAFILPPCYWSHAVLVCSITCWWGQELGSHWHPLHISTGCHYLKDEFPKTYVQTWYTKQTQLDIYSNFIRPTMGPNQWVSLSNMLPILPPPLSRSPGRPIKVKRHKFGVHNQVVAPTQQQATPNQQKNAPTQ
ncbi:hypothetical protein GOBAR_AA03887 [Gossypium barbadense]|uniref:Uncharacterized protein n=1 Tax=Gossypium barbadense TaxID=3634 RepID=A0A2P5YM60_GOSBA|nr:hypothetical protein GOBAR_AA03887 [Gossypium barbadense]